MGLKMGHMPPKVRAVATKRAGMWLEEKLENMIAVGLAEVRSKAGADASGF